MAIRNKTFTLTLLIRLCLASPLRTIMNAVTVDNDGAEPTSPGFWYHIAISAVLVLAGGVFAGYETQSFSEL